MTGQDRGLLREQEFRGHAGDIADQDVGAGERLGFADVGFRAGRVEIIADAAQTGPPQARAQVGAEDDLDAALGERRQQLGQDRSDIIERRIVTALAVGLPRRRIEDGPNRSRFRPNVLMDAFYEGRPDGHRATPHEAADDTRELADRAVGGDQVTAL